MAKKQFVSKNLINKLSHAYYHEIENQIIYSMIASWLDSKGLYSLSKYYDEWSNEERNHSQWVKEFLQSMSVQLPVSAELKIDELSFNTIYSFVEHTVDRENETTDIYNDIYFSAMDEKNSVVMEFVSNTMQKEQIEEIDKSYTLLDQVNNMNDIGELQRFDKNFPEKYY